MNLGGFLEAFHRFAQYIFFFLKSGFADDFQRDVLDIFKDAKEKFGSRAWSSMVVKRLEDKYKLNFRAPGFPKELKDFEKQKKGYEI